MKLDCGGNLVDLTTPKIMGVLNITPDSFSDGGRYFDHEDALEQARVMVAAGADIIDIGGESTRPGAQPVSVDEELRRVLPVIEKLAPRLDTPISIDTSKPEVMRAAASAGAGMINDVYALRLPGAVEAAADTGLPVCIMHMQGEPRTMQKEPHYVDVIAEVCEFLSERVHASIEGGIDKDRIVLDPGFGFGKSVEHNMTLLAGLDLVVALGFPVLAGLSRKSTIGAITGASIEDRLAGSLAAAVLAVERGARIVRVHDVRETRDALAVLDAVAGAPRC